MAGPIADDITGVLTNARGDVLTFGVLFALYFASSGVESLRIGLNRAYDMVEPRAWWLLRLESILYVLIGAVAILAFSFLVVLAPFIWGRLVILRAALAPFGVVVTFARYAVAAVVLVIALTDHALWLPAGRRSFGEIAPGIVATLVLWLISGAVFGRYLAELRLRLCVDVCRARLGDGRAGVSLCLRVDLHLRRRIEFGDQAKAAAQKANRKPPPPPPARPRSLAGRCAAH